MPCDVCDRNQEKTQDLFCDGHPVLVCQKCLEEHSQTTLEGILRAKRAVKDARALPPMTPPRKCRLDHMTPAELAIYQAVEMVEYMGADTRLTEAVVLLGQARDKVAAFVDDE